jgi:hypothetical protein
LYFLRHLGDDYWSNYNINVNEKESTLFRLAEPAPVSC